jgi:hypothetical protein
MSMLIWDMRDMVNGTDVFAYRGNFVNSTDPYLPTLTTLSDLLQVA